MGEDELLVSADRADACWRYGDLDAARSPCPCTACADTGLLAAESLRISRSVDRQGTFESRRQIRVSRQAAVGDCRLRETGGEGSAWRRRAGAGGSAVG